MLLCECYLRTDPSTHEKGVDLMWESVFFILTKTIAALEAHDNQIPCILGARIRKVEVIRDRVLSHPGSHAADDTAGVNRRQKTLKGSANSFFVPCSYLKSKLI